MDESEVVAALFQAFGTRDVDTALALSDPEIEFWPQVIMALTGRTEPYRGHAGIRAYFEDIAAVFERVEIDVWSMRTVVGGAAVFGVSRGLTVDGHEIEAPLIVVGRLRSGRVIYARSHATKDEANRELAAVEARGSSGA